ncbi:MAG: hypothetical protein JWM68_4246 [Verrucomicrobiales bacterium]|nr:hypothetical protein [Verrucomicrobiales bacterium]
MNGVVTQNTNAKGWLPEGFVGELLPLVLNTWSDFEVPIHIVEEPKITALFKKRLKKRIKDDPENDWFIMLETSDYDDSGVEISRTDIRVLPPGKKDEDYAFVLECKRLNISHPGGKFDRNTGKYTDDGMLRFIEGTYSRGLREGGMMGFVMDSDVPAARQALLNAISTRQEKLKLRTGSGYLPCALLPVKSLHGETQHVLGNNRTFILYHLLVPVRFKSLVTSE